MTLGQKLSTYRKLAGLTQQQLGDQLSISAQAVSKWENDQTEPDLATMRVLAGIYKVTVDELLDPSSVPHAQIEEESSGETFAAGFSETAAPIGFCKTCGVTVTEENLGETSPVILCKKCLKEKKEAEKRAAEQAKREAAQRRAKTDAERAERRRKYKRHLIRSVVVASIVLAIFLALCISSLIDEFTGGTLAFTIIGTYVVFAFVFLLFYDCVVQDVVVNWITKSIRWPGLIFSFDLDGILWLIGMKLLFWALGVLFGIVMALIGGSIGLVCAPFVFPFVVVKLRNAFQSGEKCELIEDTIFE